MINIFQGTLGSGKSASMVCDLVDHLFDGGVCAANFRLTPGWPEKLAKMRLLVRLGFVDYQDVAESLHRRFKVVNTLDEVYAAGKELIPQAEGKVAQQYEGIGRLYLDEAQLIFNSRNWQDNMKWIEFFSQSRKLKWDITMVAHSINMIDKQIRPFIEFETRFRDLRKVKFLGLIPLAPGRLPVFMGITRYTGLGAGSGEIFKREVYPLQKSYSELYDSALVFGSQADNSNNDQGPGLPASEGPEETGTPGPCSPIDQIIGHCNGKPIRQWYAPQ